MRCKNYSQTRTGTKKDLSIELAPATVCGLPLQYPRGLNKSLPFTNGLLFTANLIQSNTQCLAATSLFITVPEYQAGTAQSSRQQIYPSISYTCLSFRAVLGAIGCWCNLDMLPVSSGNLDLPVNLTCVSLVCQRHSKNMQTPQASPSASGPSC